MTASARCRLGQAALHLPIDSGAHDLTEKRTVPIAAAIALAVKDGRILLVRRANQPVASDDALHAAWFSQAALNDGDLALSLDVAEVAALAFAEAGETP